MKWLLNLITELTNTWKNYRVFKIYCALIFIAFAKQMWNETQLIDTKEYMAAASNLLHGGFPDSCLHSATAHCDHWLHETRRTFGYPLLILLTFSFTKLLIFIQCVASIFIPVLLHRFMQYFNASDKWMRYSFLFLLLSPLQYFYSAEAMPEIWCQLLLLLFALYYYQQKWLKLSLTLAILMLLKPVFIILPFITFIALFKSQAKRSYLIIPFLLLLVICDINMQKTGVFHYNGMSVENAWEYNLRAILNAKGNAEKFYGKNDSVLSKNNFEQNYNFMQKAARDSIKTNLFLYSKLHVKGTLISLIDPGRYDLMAFLNLNPGSGFMGIKSATVHFWQQPAGIIFYIIIFAFINLVKWIGIGICFIKEGKNFWFIFLIVFALLVVTGPVGSARYLFPLYPVIVCMAGRGFVLLRNKNEENPLNQ
jgi:hypothetical protein